MGAGKMGSRNGGPSTWMEGLETAGCVEGDAEMSCERWGQGGRTLVRVNLLQCKRAVTQKRRKGIINLVID